MKVFLLQVVNWFRSISDSDFNGDDENVNYEQGKGMTVVDIESDNCLLYTSRCV